MRVTVNEAFIKRRANIARWSTLVGLGVLFLGLFLSFNQQYYYWSLPALIVGFLLANISGFNANRYVKEPRPDQSLARALRGFDNTYHLFNYTAPIPHVLLTPSRVYALLVKPQDGVIRKTGNRWRRDFSWRRLFLFFGEEGVGNPPREARAVADRLQRALEESFGEEAPSVEPLVVFTNPDVELVMTDLSDDTVEDVPVLIGARLKKHLRAQSKGEPFSPDLRKRLVNFLKGVDTSQEDDTG
ncbi:MAG: hypothetical protein Kow0063_17540 [Anaerolineae bacterium]